MNRLTLSGLKRLLGYVVALAALVFQANAQVEIDATSSDPVFIASGEPRSAFATAYIPDGGSNSLLYANELNLLGLSYDRYASLTEANILQMVKDPDMVALVPGNLLGGPNAGVFFDGNFFAFVSTPEGLQPVRVVRSDGMLMEPRDLAPMAAATLPVVRPAQVQTTLMASVALPASGRLEVFRFGMKMDEAGLAQILAKAGLASAPSTLIDAAGVPDALTPGSALLFMPLTQTDPALSPLFAPGAGTRFHAVTNFGLVPVRPEAAVEILGLPPIQSPTPVVAAAPPAPAAIVETSPVAPELPPAAAHPNLDISDTEALAAILPAGMLPENVRKADLVWRARRAAGGQIFDISDAERVENLARIAREALPGVRFNVDGNYSELIDMSDGPASIILKNMRNSGTAQLIRMQDLAEPLFGFLLDDPAVTVWHLTSGGLRRIASVTPAAWPGAVAFENLPDPALVAFMAAGMNPGDAASAHHAGIVVLQEDGKDIDSAKRIELLGWPTSDVIARQLDIARDDLRTTDVLRVSGTDGALAPAEDRAVLRVMTAGQLRDPKLAPLLAGGSLDFWLLAWNRLTSVTIGTSAAALAATPESAAAQPPTFDLTQGAAMIAVIPDKTDLADQFSAHFATGISVFENDIPKINARNIVPLDRLRRYSTTVSGLLPEWQEVQLNASFGVSDGEVYEPRGGAIFVIRSQDLADPQFDALRAARGVSFSLLSGDGFTPIQPTVGSGTLDATPAITELAAVIQNRDTRAHLAEAAGGALASPRGDSPIGVAVTFLPGVDPGACVTYPKAGPVYSIRCRRDGGVPLLNAVKISLHAKMAEPYATLFAQDGVAVLLPGGNPGRNLQDLGHPFYDPLFDGSRRFVRVTDGTPIEMPALERFAPPAQTPVTDAPFCGVQGGPLKIWSGSGRGVGRVFHDDLMVVALARAVMDRDPTWQLELGYESADRNGAQGYLVSSSGVAAREIGQTDCDRLVIEPMSAPAGAAPSVVSDQ
ncbi:hypothetical protein [Roseovarius sp. M141]|uniref:hypothetical protein n=1 Tax=Roseovarius sp. M141 TaxID=2583806 RepID=UPI0020CCFD6B|nr:hypothetical protein [Roseovarius sp. M141]MCQ0091813.1 hypothetical protein [Roseovarius sp. M141]